MPQLPSSHLPRIKSIFSFSPAEISSYLIYLRTLYNPPVRGSRRRRLLVSTISSADDSEDVAAIRADTFERSYALRWLTALVSQLNCCDAGASATNDDSVRLTPKQKDELMATAASLLAVCAGTASAGNISRLFNFPSQMGKDDISTVIEVVLNDIPLDNHDFSSVGAQTWGGACVLAEMITENPSNFNLGMDVRETRALRVLELGAGTGLVSLVVGKLAEAQDTAAHDQSRSHRHKDIRVAATDFYPSVLDNLKHNIKQNFPAASSRLHITSCSLNWSTFPEHFPTLPSDSALYPPFDLVLGADIIYEAKHAQWVKGCLEFLLRKPSKGTPDPLFHLVIPLRPTHDAESRTIDHVFNVLAETHSSTDLVACDSELVIVSREVMICDVEGGAKDEIVEYAYYRIGWHSKGRLC